MDTTVQCTDLILWQPRASYTTVLSPDQPQTGSYEVLESYDTFPYTPSPLAIHVIPRLTPLSFFPHRLPWLRAVMASDPHGLLPTPFPLQITTLINSLPFSSHALQSDRLRPPIFAEVTKNRGPSNRPEELVMLIEAPDTLLPHVTEVIEAQLSEKSSVTPSAMCGRPTVTDGPGQEERRTETAEPGEMELQEKEAEAREREKEEGRVEEEEAFEPGEQVESLDTVKEAERAEEMGQAEDMVSVKEGDGMEPGEETEEGNAKSIEGGGAGLTKLKKAPEGARNESKEVREVQTGKEWEGAEVEAQQQSITIATAGDCGEQSLGDEVNCIVNLPDDNTASSAFPPIADGLEPFHSGMIGDELRQRNLEHMSNADGRTEEEEKEKVSKAGFRPVMPTPTTDTSSTYHIDPNPLAISSGQFTEKVDDSPAELLSSQESNGSLDVLCSSPIGSQEGDKAEDRLTQNDQAAGASPPALPDEGDEIVDSKEAKDSASSGEEEEGPELPMLQPSFSRFAQPAPVLARRTLKRKDTMQDLFSAMVPLKRKKVELTRKPAVWDQSDLQADSSGKEKGKEATGVEEKEVELEEEVDKDVLVLQGTEPTADAETRAEKPSDLLEDDPALSEEEDPKKGQWRVGRLPGNQGSHIKRDVDGVFDPEDSGKRGQKRSLGQSINDSAERVLKKPFRLPARVVLKPAPPRSKTPPSTSAPPSSSPLPSDPRSSSPSSSRTQTSGPTRSKPSSRPFSVPRKIDITPIKPSFPTRTSTPVLPPTPQSGTSTSTIRSSPFKSSPTFSRRLAKPFKTPFSRSTAPSPVSSTSRSKTPSTRELIAELEKEERTLKQAIKYHKEPEEDERLVELITTWRDAGQQVAELLFAIYPRPDSDAVNGGESSNNKPFSMYPDEQSFFARSEYTPEQLRYIANLDTNADGDPVDNDGMPIFGNGGGGMATDIEGMLEQRSGDSDGDKADGKATSKETDSTEWTIGTMLVKLGVEPGMYAWDAEVEDWGKPEEE